MGSRYRDHDRFYGRRPSSREADNYRYDRRGPPPHQFTRRPDDRRFMKEIATKALFLAAKKFYLDIVEGPSGKLLKLSEVSQTGQKSKMLMDLDTAVEFHDKISDFCDFLSKYDKVNDRDKLGHRSEAIKNDTMVKDQRRYYLDLMENHRGMFLKVTMKPSNVDRVQLVFPSSGLPEVRDALTELLSEYGSSKKRKVNDSEDCIVTDVTPADPEAVIVVPDDPNFEDEEECDVSLGGGEEDETQTRPEAGRSGGIATKTAQVDENKMDCRDRSFQFQVKSNDAGTYLSITESSAKFRSVINVPQKCWQEFVTSVEAKLRELRKSQSAEDGEDSGGFRAQERGAD